MPPADWVAERESVADERWAAYDSGPALLQRLAAPDGPTTRAVWSAAPASSWSADLAVAVRSVLALQRGGVIVVVPDARDVARVLAEFADAAAGGVVATLTAELGPERRYREFLRILRGGARLVVGTRAAVFAPVADLRLIAVWDDGDDALADPQAPYWETRDVAALRSHRTGCDLLVGSPARSVATQQWCESGWARSLQASRVDRVGARAEGPGAGERGRRARPGRCGGPDPAPGLGGRSSRTRRRSGTRAGAASGVPADAGLPGVPIGGPVRVRWPTAADRRRPGAVLRVVRRARGGVGMSGLWGHPAAGDQRGRGPDCRGDRPGFPRSAGGVESRRAHGGGGSGSPAARRGDARGRTGGRVGLPGRPAAGRPRPGAAPVAGRRSRTRPVGGSRPPDWPPRGVRCS